MHERHLFEIYSIWQKVMTYQVTTGMKFFFFFFFLISWRLITLQYCSGFGHTLTWISLGYTCIPHPDTPSHLPLHPIPLGLPKEVNKHGSHMYLYSFVNSGKLIFSFASSMRRNRQKWKFNIKISYGCWIKDLLHPEIESLNL